MKNIIGPWNQYVNGDVINYNWKLQRVQARLEGEYYINNLVDYLIGEGKEVLYDIDKIVLLGGVKPIALYPQNSENVNVDIVPYLESIKNTDINKIIISVLEDGYLTVDTVAIDETLKALKSATKIDVRYILSE